MKWTQQIADSVAQRVIAYLQERQGDRLESANAALSMLRNVNNELAEAAKALDAAAERFKNGADAYGANQTKQAATRAKAAVLPNLNALR